MAKLKTVNQWRAGQTTILPIVGKVTFSEQAEIEVLDELVEKLTAILPEFSIGEEEEELKKKVEEHEELNPSKEEDIKPQVEDAVEVEKPQPLPDGDKKSLIREKLNALKVADIKKEYLSQFPEELTKGLKSKESYIDFLVEQLSK